MMDMPTTQQPPKHHKMWMWYHTVVEDTVLIEQWTVFDAGTMIWTCAVVILAGIFLEFLKYSKWAIGISMRPTVSNDSTTYGGIDVPRKVPKILSMPHLIQTCLTFWQVLLAYLLMNVYMTFSVYICLSLCLGLAIGHYLFASRI